ANKTNTRAVISDSYYAVVTKNDAGASSDADFKSGKIAYLLNKGAEPFKQTIGTDAFPSFEGETVYEYKHCTGDPRYTNDKDQQDLHHIFSDKFEAKAPTCTTKGNNVYWLCEHEPGVYYKNPNDGHYETYANESEVFIPALGHHMVEHKAEAAKCEKEGNLLYYTCVNEPGVIYANAEATKTTTLDAVTIPATGHQLEEHILEGTITCTDDEDPNYVYFTCKNDPTEFFAKDKKTRISNPQQAIDDLSGHIWGEYKFESTLENGTEDRYVRTCLRNESHKDVITSPHAFGEWQLVESEPDHDKYVHTCTSTYGSHSEEKIEKFPVEEVTYYSQKTGERDTTFRVNTEFKAIDTENDLLLAGNTTTITGNNVVAGDVCKNLVITDKVDFSTPIDFVAEELTYTRNDTARYQSFVLPYEVPMTSFNGVVYSFSEYIESRNSVKFTSVEEPSVKAGYPCILYNVKDGGKRHKIHNKLEDVILSQNLKAGAIGNNMCFYRGTFKAESGTVTKTKKYYGFKDNKFVAAGETYKLNAFRALIELHKAQGAPQASLGLIFDDELTGVTTIDAEGNFTISNVDVYDMTGRLVRKNVESATCLQGLKPGIYVVNGEKFVKTANE
ncbi:MAG: T9SS type A sorting domain-containing protein, partial [Paludibacteraceae bacterium]|nr:T9SS type A sorting domain-containing protein [Paludibacteraceae bacterium]